MRKANKTISTEKTREEVTGLRTEFVQSIIDQEGTIDHFVGSAFGAIRDLPDAGDPERVELMDRLDDQITDLIAKSH